MGFRFFFVSAGLHQATAARKGQIVHPAGSLDDAARE
jgi:hypothetical protein